jgi:hypothetical protein
MLSRPSGRLWDWRPQSEQPRFHWAAENECKDIVEELATAQAKEETAQSIRARAIGAPTTLGTFARNQNGKEG